MKKKIIKLIELWKVYKRGKIEVPALTNINLDIYQGDFVAILGPSGSGKSTFLNSIGFLDVPTKGTLELEDTNISSLNESQLAQIRGKKIGFIFQQFNLINTISAIENVMLPMIFQNVPESQRTKRATELLTSFGLKDRLHHKPTELSGGEQQRVAIARALLKKAPILVLDEATSSLDSESEKYIQEGLWELMKGKTTLVVAHRLSTIKHLDRIVVLDDGHIVEDGTHDELIEKNGLYARLWKHQSGEFIGEQ